MRIEVHKEQCICAGNCTQIAPKYFSQDETGIVVALESEVAEEDRDSVRLAAEACPTLAITLVDGS